MVNWLAEFGRQALEVRLAGQTMGNNSYEVKYILTAQNQLLLPQPEAIKAGIEGILALVMRQMSVFDVQSSISRFNAFAYENTPFLIEEDFARVVAEGVRLHALTEGFLDIGLGRLFALWGEERQQGIDVGEGVVNVRLMRDALGRVMLSKAKADLALDVSAIAKGYAVDCVADYLQALGIEDYLVDIGGELRVLGRSILQIPWLIAVARAHEWAKEEEDYQAFVQLSSGAIATSGGYINYYVNEKGEALSHVFNPRVRRAVGAEDLLSVSVIADCAMTADGLATGLFAAGLEIALNIAEKNNIAMMAVAAGQRVFISSAFEPYLLD